MFLWTSSGSWVTFLSFWMGGVVLGVDKEVVKGYGGSITYGFFKDILYRSFCFLNKIVAYTLCLFTTTLLEFEYFKKKT